MTKLLVTGAEGRMGQAVISCAGKTAEIEVGAQIDMGALKEALANCDTVIDFSHHSFTTELLEACLQQNIKVVTGTTGHSDEELAFINKASESIAIVKAPNFSVGVNTLFYLTRRATEILGDNFDLEVVEMHHRDKVDSPSGTARRLVEILDETRGLSYADDTMHGRHGDVGPRKNTEIGLHAVRGGDVVGDHTVIYAGSGERVELTHKASSRDTFASGAVRSALWLQDQNKGLFDMQDVLGLR
ncbi:MAG: 4-hydroxy-tetrahydrodipicolinate reductase [Verrucomicrobia bacterium]|nr:4-hydroxy-tetrahydrodipicolinate reductase [Verrucomicrobiota bacterium]